MLCNRRWSCEGRCRSSEVAADQGVADAQYNLALCYATGDGVVKDAAEAARYFKVAADQGAADAQYNLAVCYATGDGGREGRCRSSEVLQTSR